MNQEQVKDKLLELQDSEEHFTVTFSGKSSKRVNGLYKPDSREIIIHNRNMSTDNSVMYTAIHEYAHHIHVTGSQVPVSSKAHTNTFWNIFHNLLVNAEEKGIYQNVFISDKSFIELTAKIKHNFLAVNGKLMKELGELLISAMDLCREKDVSFNDYIDRVLSINRTTAKTVMRAFADDINESIGYDNMKTVLSIRDGAKREEAENSFINGMSPDMVKAEYLAGSSKTKDDPVKTLEAEKKRLERTIQTLSARLSEIEHRITTLNN